jgi:succinate dehydrogenase / fumarate reductase flavoprotein subunit
MTTDSRLNSKAPQGAIEDKWNNYKADVKLVNPNNKRKFKVIVVGTGLAGASAAATLAELGYQVDAFTFHDSPRRAHSIAAQGGINAAKNYRGDGDSVHRLFYDTVKGGDFRSRESNVHRLAEVSVNIIDQMVAQGVPFAREYGGLLDNRSLAPRSAVLFTPAVRLASNFCLVPTSSWRARSVLVAFACSTAQN